MAERIIPVQCRECAVVTELTVQAEDFLAWANGKFAQEAFPYLTAADRELLISKTCGSCFDKIFPPDGW